jgi:abortive infection bacteriophage resistance protein
MPIWVAVEIFDFGDISKLLRLSSQKLASNIANEFGTQPSMFKSWVASLNELRNAVVHQNRLWNRTFTYSTGKKLSNLPSSLKHLSSAELDARLMYTRLAILVSIDEASSLKINFKARLMELFQSFPENEFVTIEQMGFPEGWKEFPLWQG